MATIWGDSRGEAPRVACGGCEGGCARATRTIETFLTSRAPARNLNLLKRFNSVIVFPKPWTTSFGPGAHPQPTNEGDEP
ncbi:hypothetical protein ACFPRL_19330 [Pseudoclavibacter helvolus]